MSDRCYTDFHLFQICLASVDYLFHTDGHGCELTKTKTITKTLSVLIRLNSDDDVLSADVRQMLYGFSSVSNLFNICGLYWSASGRGCGQELP